MKYFPQLSTGALAHFPMIKQITRRTVTNRLPDGRALKYVDSGVLSVEWDLRYTSLTAGEAAAIEGFFSECEGDLLAFGFLDPTGNLLAWSEDLGQETWTKDPLVTATHGLDDPQGGDHAVELRNNASALQGIRQTVMAPGGFTYCFSAWVRSNQGASLFMTIGSARCQREAGPTWTRITMTAIPAETEEGVSFGLEFSGSQIVETFGLQAEAQPGNSAYKQTGSKGAVYSACRFGQPQLTVTADGPDSYSCRFTVISNGDNL
jgi:hypothetical protein